MYGLPAIQQRRLGMNGYAKWFLFMVIVKAIYWGSKSPNFGENIVNLLGAVGLLFGIYVTLRWLQKYERPTQEQTALDNTAEAQQTRRDAHRQSP
jgi:hypothetical protein